MTQLAASPRLMDLIFEAVREGLTPLRAGQELSPFVMLVTKEGYVLRRFAGATVREQIDNAYAALKNQDSDTLAYALVYDAVVTLDRRDTDALMIEAGERGQPDGLRFAQRYQPRSESTPFYTIGELAYLGQAEQYLT